VELTILDYISVGRKDEFFFLACTIFLLKLQMMGHLFSFQLQFFFAVANVRGLIDGFKDFYVFGGYFLLLPNDMPTKFDVMFSQGIHPIVTKPSKCHGHPEVQYNGRHVKK
jgi:hypothetical protein